MAFSSSWTYIAIDKFSAVNEKMAKAARNFRRSVGKIDTELKKHHKQLNKTKRVTQQSLQKVNREYKKGSRAARKWAVFVWKANKKVRASFKKVRDAAQKSLKKVNEHLMKGLGKGFKAGLAGATLGIGVMIRQGMQFEDAMADLSAITGATGKDFDVMQGKILALAKAHKVYQADVANAVTLVASEKAELLKNIPALTAVTDKVLLLKNAAGTDMATAAEITTRALNIFQAEVSKTGKFVDIMAAGAKHGSSRIHETGEALIVSGAAAKAAGLSFMQTNAAIQVIAKGGFKGSQAGTALSAILGRLRRAGFNIQELGLEKTFAMIGKGLESIEDPTKRALAEAKLFGEEHSKVGLALVSNAHLFGSFEKKLMEQGVAQEQANIRLSTFSAELRGIGVNINEKLIKVFNRIAPALKAVADDFGKWLDTIDSQDIDNVIASLKEAGDAMTSFVQIMAGAAKPFIATIGFFKELATWAGEAAAAIATGDFDQFTAFQKTGQEKFTAVREDALAFAETGKGAKLPSC